MASLEDDPLQQSTETPTEVPKLKTMEPLEKDLDKVHVSDTAKKPEAAPTPSGREPAVPCSVHGPVPVLQQVCRAVMVKVESQLMKMIVEERSVVDRQVGEECIKAWHFDFIEDSRNYLVYHIVDLLVGLAPRGAERLQKALSDVRFQDLVRFVVREENDCFLHAVSQADYFGTLANCTMRLSTLEHLAYKDDEFREADVLVDPVDTLFELHSCDGCQVCNRADIDQLLEQIKCRMKDAKKDNDSPSKPVLTMIQVKKENFKFLLKFERRMEKLSSAVKLISQQMLQREEDGDAKVVTLFGLDIFFVAPPESRTLVDKFFSLQKNLINNMCDGQDQADAQACLKCPDFLPLLKEVTCMPKSVLTYIDNCCKQFGKQQSETDDKATENSVDNGKLSQEETSDKESGEQSTKEGKEPSEQTPESAEGRQKQTSKSQMGRRNADEQLSEELDEGIGDSEYIFTVCSSPTEGIDYLCPMLSYLPLLPVLKVLSGKTTSDTSAGV